MVETLLAVVRKYPESSARRQAIEPELEKDLEYVKGNMTLNPKVVQRRTNMRSMHQDFFSLLKWQREKMLRVPFEEPHKLTGDIESLKAELNAKKGETVEEAVQGKLVPSEEVKEMTIQERAAAGGCPVAHKIPAGATMEDCPVAHKLVGNTAATCPVDHANGASGTCPIDHKANGASAAATGTSNGNGQFTIHRLYD